MGSTAHHSPLASLRAFVFEHRSELWTVVLYAVFIGLIGLATPVAVQALVSSAAFSVVLQPIAVLSLMLLAGLAFSGLLKALKFWTVELLQRRLFVRAVARLAYVFPRLAQGQAHAHGIELPSQRYFELFVTHKAVASLLLGALDAALATVVGLLVLAFYHPLLLAFDAVLVLALVCILFVLGRGGLDSAIKESSAKYRLAAFFAEIERSPERHRGEAQERAAHGEVDRLCREYLEARSVHYRVVLRQLLGALTTQALVSAALLGLGGYLVVRRELTLGQLVAAELIVTAVVAALGDLGKHIETYYDLVASRYKLDAVLDLPVEGDAAAPSAGPSALGGEA